MTDQIPTPEEPQKKQPRSRKPKNPEGETIDASATVIQMPEAGGSDMEIAPQTSMSQEAGEQESPGADYWITDAFDDSPQTIAAGSNLTQQPQEQVPATPIDQREASPAQQEGEEASSAQVAPSGDELTMASLPDQGAEQASGEELRPVEQQDTPPYAAATVIHTLETPEATAEPAGEAQVSETPEPASPSQPPQPESEQAPPGVPFEPPPPPPPPGAPPALSPSDERTWAMIAHLSVLVNLVTGLLGPVVALVIYLVFKDRSRYVAYQSLQAFVFQLVWWGGGIALIGIMWAITGLLSAIVVGLLCIPFAILGTIGLGILPVGALIYGTIGAIQTAQGQDFSYWLVGDWVRGTLQQD